MGYSKNNVEQRINKFKSLEHVSIENKEDFEDFINYLQADSNVSDSRIYKYISAFNTLFDTNEKYSSTNFIPQNLVLKQAEKDQVRKIVGKIEASSYSEWTKADFKVTLKKYFNTLYEDEIDRPKRVKKILQSSYLKKPSNIQNKRDIHALTASEIQRMMEEAENARDRLIPVFMFEVGCRIGECLGLRGAEGIRLKDIELKQKYAEVKVETLKNQQKGVKTLQLVRSVGLLQEWMEKHPRKDNPEAHLFVNIGSKYRGKCMSEKNFGDVLKKLGEKAGIAKPIRNHILRHSSATYKGTELGWNIQRMMYWHVVGQMKVWR